MALNILGGKPYEKEQLLMSALVTHDNANVLYMQAKETDRQTAYLDQLHKRADNYLREINAQKLTLLLALIVIVLLLAVIVLYYLYRNGKITLRRQHVVSTLWNMDESKIEKNEIKINVDKEDNYFITHFKEVIESRLDNSDLSIEDLAADMNLSRVQLYRKVKSVTNMSPVELLRTARLNRAYQLLITTKKTVSEVAYAVGFSAPSYFTKCFKEEYGVLPNDVR
jgi:AraC-like DNA-binding protein